LATSQPSLPLILVVDDDSIMQAMLSQFLEKTGFKVIVAEDGVSAIQAYKDYHPNLILMDASMPDMDGFETTRAIAALPDSKNTPIIMVTGLTDGESVDTAFKAGAEEYITKPINWAVLKQRTEFLIKNRKMETSLKESEERFRSIAESARDAIVSINEAGLITFWNHGAEILFGYTKEEILNRPLTPVIPEQLRSSHQQGIERASKSGIMKLEGAAVELTGVRKDGETFPLEISLSTWKSGEAPFFSAIIRDVTERVAARAKRDQTLQSQLAISALLETALESISLERQLEVALDIITTVPWLRFQFSTAGFIPNKSRNHLTLVASRDLNSSAVHACSRIPMGHCLCGKAAQSRKVHTVMCRDYPEPLLCDTPKTAGHHCIPIVSKGETLAVLNLCMTEEHIFGPDEDAFLTTFAHTLVAVIESRRMAEEIKNAQLELRETRLEIIHRLGLAAEYKDTDTGEHIIRMSHFAAALGSAYGLSQEETELLLHATPMHDVGKIGIPDHILLKPGRLNEEEFKHIKKHPLIGATMLYGHQAEPLRTAHIIALTHHEKWDGSGYPHGLVGEDIPLVGRITALVDVFDALTSTRPYKEGWSTDAALMEIEKCSGSHFDPALVTIFKNIFPEILQIRARLAGLNTETGSL
jgi:PAS domain S-box-containing protein